MTVEERMTNAPRAPRRDAGVPRGPERRKHCGICGAEGVDRRTCTGDAGSHAALDQGYKPSPLPRVNGPSTATHATGTRQARTPNVDLEGLDAGDAAEVLQGAGALAPDVLPTPSNLEPDEDPIDEGFVTLREALVHEVVLTVVSRYPALVMGRLEHWIEENLEEALWVSTEAHGLTRIES